VKKAIFFIGKILIAVALIVLLLRLGRLDFSAVRRFQLDLSTLAWLLAGAAAIAVGNGFTAVRLRVLLRHAGITVTFARVLGIAFAGTFIGYVLPGLVFGDAFKAVYLYRDARDHKTAAVVMVLLDRAIGLFSFLLLSSLALLLGLAIGYVSQDMLLLLLVPAVTAMIVLAGYLLGKFGRQWLWPSWTNRIVFVRYLRDGFDILRDYLASSRLVLLSLAYSMINHLLIVVSFIIAARVIGVLVPAYAHFILDPIAMIANAIPITPGGLGITESVFSLLYQIVGSDQGAVVGLTGRFLQYAAYIVGGVTAIILLDVKVLIHKKKTPVEARVQEDSMMGGLDEH
jgi:hypothetical protein